MSSKLEPSSLNKAFLKYFPISQAEKKAFLQKKEFCFGERILIHYGIEPLPKLALEFERVVFDALFSWKPRRTEITPNWIGDLFFIENPGYSLSGAMFGICLKDGIKETRNFIESVDYLGICWLFINYWNLHRKEKEEAFPRDIRNTFIFLPDEETSPIFKVSESQFQKWKKSLKIPQPISNNKNDLKTSTRPFLCGDKRLMSELEEDELEAIIIEAYAGLVWRMTQDEKTTIQQITRSDDMTTLLQLLENQHGKKRGERKILNIVSSIKPKFK